MIINLMSGRMLVRIVSSITLPRPPSSDSRVLERNIVVEDVSGLEAMNGRRRAGSYVCRS